MICQCALVKHGMIRWRSGKDTRHLPVRRGYKSNAWRHISMELIPALHPDSINCLSLGSLIYLFFYSTTETNLRVKALSTLNITFLFILVTRKI